MESVHQKASNGYYTPKQDYPSRYVRDENLKEVKDDVEQNFVGTLIQIKSEVVRRQELVREEFKAALEDYQEEEANLLLQFKKDLLEEYDVTGHPKADKCYAMAWEKGSSSGLYSVAQEFEELVELIK